LGALGHLFLETTLGLAQFFFQGLLRCEIGDDDANRVRLRLKFGKRHEHRNLAAVAWTERVFAAHALLSGPFEIFEKLIAHLRRNEVAKGHTAGVSFGQPENAAKVTIAVKNV